MTAALLTAGVRAERALPRPLWSLAAPVLRPAASRIVWGVTNSIAKSFESRNEQAARTHPVVAAPRPGVTVREKRRKRCALGTDYDIARRQRAGINSLLQRIKATDHPVRPQEAVTIAR